MSILAHSTKLEFGSFVTEIEHLPATGKILVHNFLPTFRSVSIDLVDEVRDDEHDTARESETEDPKAIARPFHIRLAGELDGSPLFETFHKTIDPRKDHQEIDLIPHCAILPSRISRITENSIAEITVGLEFDGGWIEKTFLLKILAPNEWFNHPSFYESLAGFVQPNDPDLVPILRRASSILKEETGSSSLEGYQRGATRATEIAGALFEALRGENITYTEPPASFEGTGQRVRTSSEVVDSKLGTCIDLAVLYAALLEQVGLHAAILLIDGHALPAFMPLEYSLSLPVVFDRDEISNLIKSEIIVPVETTLVCGGKESNFGDSIKHALHTLRTTSIYGLLSVQGARADRVLPLSSDNSSSPLQKNDGEVVEVARNWNASSILKVEEPTEFLVSDESNVPPRIQTWKKELLDLSMRNRLLNLKPNREVIELEVRDGMLAALEDYLYTQRPLTLLPKDYLSEAHRLKGVQTASQLDDDFVGEQFNERDRVYVDVTEKRYKTVFNGVRRVSKMLFEETGSSNLYLSLGSLEHTLDSGEKAISPLFLMPVRLEAGRGNAHTQLVTDTTTSGTPNYCLVEWLRQVHGVTIDALEKPPLDEAGLDISAALRSISAELAQAKLPFTVNERSHILVAKFSTYGMWRDLDTHWEIFLKESPVFEHLTLKPGQTFSDPFGSEPIQKTVIDEAKMALPIAADGSQLQAIAAAEKGRSFVLEGPPGTGKSQTITNLIAHCLNSGKKILFVAEKQAALEVVKTRLEKVGLGSYTLDLHGADQKPSAIRQQIKNAMDTEVSYDPHGWKIACAKLESAIKPLAEYPDQIHSENASGQSLWSATTSLLQVGEGPVANIPQSYVADPKLDEEQVKGSLKELAYLQRELSSDQLSAWSLVGNNLSSTDHVEFVGSWEKLSSSFDILNTDQLFSQLTADGEDLQTCAEAAETIASFPSHERINRDEVSQIPSTCENLLLMAQEVDKLRQSVRGLDLLFSNEFLAHGDCDQLIHLAEESEKGLFGRKKRREAYYQQLAASVPLNFVDSIDIESRHSPERIVPMLKRIPIIRDSAQHIMQRLDSMVHVQNLLHWSPLQDGFAEELTKLADHLQQQSQLAETWPHLYFLDSDRLQTFADHSQSLLSAWRSWLATLKCTDESVRKWQRSEPWVNAWRRDMDQWAKDIKASGLKVPRSVFEHSTIVSSFESNNLQGLVQQQAVSPIDPSDVDLAVIRGIAQASVLERTDNSHLDRFRVSDREDQFESFKSACEAIREESRKAIAANLQTRRSYSTNLLSDRAGRLRRSLERKRGARTFRSLFREFSDVILETTPCVFVSPSSLATHIEPGSATFDIVIFDEASQVRVDQAMGALGRGRSAIIVGDSKQMPPTSFGMSTGGSDEDFDYDSDESNGDSFESLESILSEADESGLPKLWLTWHYRSRDESLIDFSNGQYYEGRLASLPTPGGDTGVGVEIRNVHGLFNREKGKLHRTNMVEAEAIVEEITNLVNNPLTANDSIGVVTFNIQQRDLILDLLEDKTDPMVQERIAPGPESIFVKNLDNVQGDERDIILFSTAFSKSKDGQPMRMNFGPITRRGGERRLNVAITRARKRVMVFTSFEPAEIDLSRTSSLGMRDLRAYMERALGQKRTEQLPRNYVTFDNTIQSELVRRLQDRGWKVETNYGLSSFTIDLVLSEPDEERWQVAIMLDGPEWRKKTTVADRELTPELLKTIMNWAGLVRIWLPEFQNFDAVIARIEDEQSKAKTRLQQLDEETTARTLKAKQLLEARRNELEEKQRSEEIARSEAIEELQQADQALDPDEVEAIVTDKIEYDSAVDADSQAESAQWEVIEEASNDSTSELDQWADSSQFYDDIVTEEDSSDDQGLPVTPLSHFPPEAGSRFETQEFIDWTKFHFGEREEIERGLSHRRLNEIRPIVASFIEQHGPMPFKKFCTHIANGFHRDRVTGKLADNVEALIPMDQVYAEFATGDSFIWPSNADPRSWNIARQSHGKRYLADISLREIANAVEIVCEQKPWLRNDFDGYFEDILSDTLHFFGLSKRTKTARERLKAAIATFI